MTYLLDTNACIVYLRTPRNLIREHLQTLPLDEVCVCSVVKAELFHGAMKYSDPASRLARLADFFAPFPSLPFDDEAARVFGEIRASLQRAGTVIGPFDLMIAAIALTSGMTLVTHNTGEFSRVPELALEDWEA